MPDEEPKEPVEEILTPQERTISYVLNSLVGAFTAAKTAIHNVEYFLYTNPLKITAQQTVDLLGKQGKELVELCDEGKLWLIRLRAFLQAAHGEVVLAQKDSVKAADVSLAVKAIAENVGAAIVDHKPPDMDVVKNPDGTVTIAVVEVKP